jgi:hypothetical protein
MRKQTNKQTNKHAESESEVFSKPESADFREVRGLGLGRPKSSAFFYYLSDISSFCKKEFL